MTNKTFSTAMGQTVDLGALALKHENTPAVGNMGVNAAGQEIQRQKPRQTGPITTSVNPTQSRLNTAQRRPVDSSARAARQRLAEEARQEAERLQQAQAEAELRAARVATAVTAAPVGILTPSVPEPVVAELAELTQVEPELVIDPLALTLDDPVTEPVPTSGLAAALARAAERRSGGTNGSV